MGTQTKFSFKTTIQTKQVFQKKITRKYADGNKPIRGNNYVYKSSKINGIFKLLFLLQILPQAVLSQGEK